MRYYDAENVLVVDEAAVGTKRPGHDDEPGLHGHEWEVSEVNGHHAWIGPAHGRPVSVSLKTQGRHFAVHSHDREVGQPGARGLLTPLHVSLQPDPDGSTVTRPNPPTPEVTVAPRTRRKPAPVLPLAEFEGAHVAGVTFDFTKVNDALRDVVLPDSVMVGDDVFVVLRGRVTEVAFRETSPDSDTRLRKHKVVAQEGGFAAEIDAKLLLEAERERQRERNNPPAEGQASGTVVDDSTQVEDPPE